MKAKFLPLLNDKPANHDYTCTCEYVHINMYVCIYACIYVYVYICVYIQEVAGTA